MNEIRDKVAVVTGAASGIGLALCSRFVAQGARVVMADIEEEALERARAEVTASGAEVHAVVTDVSSAESVAALAAQSLDAFGAIHIVCNNAGVFSGGLCWEASLDEYEWVMGVNVWGVVHGIRTFVPILLEQAEPTHMVNTASMAALTTMPFAGIYHMSKHAVLALSECLYHELRAKGAPVGVSVVCPEGIRTGIDRSDRNRPGEFEAGPGSAERDLIAASLSQTVAAGLPPEVIADRTLDAIRENRFYVLAEDAWRGLCNARLDDIREARNPVLRAPEVG